MSKDNGMPAFPGTAANYVYDGCAGMTLRQYAAIKAMQGICAHPDTWGLQIHEIASRSYEIADAVIAEGEK